jgi:hypothetical protein
MNRDLRFTTITLMLLDLGACSFDLVEVEHTNTTEGRQPSLALSASTRRNEPTQIAIRFDPGISADGLSRALPDDSVIIAGVKYPPTTNHEGLRAYSVDGVNVPAGPHRVAATRSRFE